MDFILFNCSIASALCDVASESLCAAQCTDPISSFNLVEMPDVSPIITVAQSLPNPIRGIDVIFTAYSKQSIRNSFSNPISNLVLLIE